jgi:hypothetical protein
VSVPTAPTPQPAKRTLGALTAVAVRVAQPEIDRVVQAGRRDEDRLAHLSARDDGGKACAQRGAIGGARVIDSREIARGGGSVERLRPGFQLVE